jgi:hypothetical protein
LEFPKLLLGVYSALDCWMVLFQYVVQVLYRPMSAAPLERSFFLLYVGIAEPYIGARSVFMTRG